MSGVEPAPSSAHKQTFAGQLWRVGGADPELWEAWMLRAQAGNESAYRQLLLAALPLLRDVAGRHLADKAATERLVGATVRTIHAFRHTY